jgi:hypothetical protein
MDLLTLVNLVLHLHQEILKVQLMEYLSIKLPQLIKHLLQVTNQAQSLATQEFMGQLLFLDQE